MVRGNWQKRVERTEARRQEAKQAKQKKQDRRLFKLQAQKLLHLLDKHGNRPLRLHIWTDTITSNGPVLTETEEVREVGGGKKKKGRNRSNSNAGETPKKVHPRSKEAVSSTSTAGDEDQAPLSCMSQFYHGKCNNTQKKGGCRYMHYQAPLKTLGSVLVDKNTQDVAKSSAMQAMIPDETLELEPNAMEMLNYTLVDVQNDGEDELSDEVVQQLSEHDIKIANLVYVVVGESLIFDRCREGVFLEERDMLMALGGHDELGKRRISVGSESEIHGTLTKLPGSVLEHVLTYLPDSAVAACNIVCKDWYSEIGKASPHLWRHLLERRQWPAPQGEDQSQQAFRKIFVQHYTAVRDVKAVKLAMTAFSTRKTQSEHEMCYQDFSARKLAPTEPNTCNSVKVWSPNRILVAYAQDCGLRLFQAVPKSSEEKLCKELVFQRLDPFKNTKRQHCTLLSMDLDEECIGSLCHVRKDGDQAQKFILVVVNREEFLLGESSAILEKSGHIEDVPLHVIDVGEAAINYLLSTDTVDHRQLQLMDFLQDGGDLGEIEVLASSTIVACGSGRFMVEVSISIPTDRPIDGEGVDEEQQLFIVDRKLVLFSTSVGAIVWVGDSGDSTTPLQPRSEELTLSGLRRIMPGDYRPICKLVVASPTSPALNIFSVDPSGSVQGPVLLEGSIIVRNEVLADGWELVPSCKRMVLSCEDCTIAADNLQKDVGDRVFDRKSVLSFYSNQPIPEYHTLAFPKSQILRMAILHDAHVVLVCREYGDFIQVNGTEGVQPMTLAPQSACIIIIHIPTRKEIYRTAAGVEDFEDDSISVPLFSTHNFGTVGCALNWSGVSITGDDVRILNTSDVKIESGSSPKKKKKASSKGNAKGRKKDGFARGMSARG